MLPLRHRLSSLARVPWPPPTSTSSRRHLLVLCTSNSSSAGGGGDAAPASAPAQRRRRRATTASSVQQAEAPQPGSSSSFSTSSSSSAATNKAPRRPSRKASSKSRPASSGGDDTPAAGNRTNSSRSRSPTPTSPAAAPAGVQQQPQHQVFAPAPQLPGADAVSSWVVFSDLHVSNKTLGTAVDVLRRVHEEARSRQAGVLFLGDFWDRRGDLPVIPLNTIHSEMQSWGDTPLLMLAGNHDQVDLAGQHHALDPVAVAAQNAHVFTQPTIYNGALWLPYRREEAVIRSAIAAALQQGPPRAIFGHADVLSAHMNASYQARDGLPPDLFPQRVPVYLGHYHFPHTVPGTAITYVGSQYQVTASEAGQSKRLLLLDPHWQQVGSIPINIGRKFFSLSTPAAAAGNAGSIISSSSSSNGNSNGNGDGSNGSGQEGATAAGGSDGVDSSSSSSTAAPIGGVLPWDVQYVAALLQQGALSAGDVLHVRAEQDDASEGQVREVLRLLEQQGVNVQVHRSPSSSAYQARIDAAEQLSMSQLLEVYAAHKGMRADVLAAARTALKELGSQSSAVPPHSHLELEEVTVEGFGPFADPITYPLSGRGVVAVTGLNKDDAAAVSNGAGKTSLLTSLLWAFKAPDGRKMTNADYINDSCRTARVTVTGRINTEPFELTRTASKSKSSLRLTVNGQDLTRQEQRLTEAELEARFSASLLPKTLVFTQEDLLGLLQSGDSQTKEMLGCLVDTGSWLSARDAAAARISALNKQLNMAAGVMQSLQAGVAQLQQDMQQTGQQEAEWWQALRAQQVDAEGVERVELQQAANAAAETTEMLEVCSDILLPEMQTLQQGLKTAIAEVTSKAAAAAAEAEAAAAASGSKQRQQDSGGGGSVGASRLPPAFDAAAAEAELQPLLAAEAAAEQQLQGPRQQVQELRAQLAAAARRREQYQRLQAGSSSNSSHETHSGSSGSSSGGGVTTARGLLQPVCEQCLQPINVELYTKNRNLQDMAADEQQLQQQLDAAAAQVQQLTAARTAAEQARQALQRQQQRERQEAAAAREAALAAQAEEGRARAREAEQQQRQQLQQQAAQQQALNQIWQEERRLSEVSRQLQSLHASLSREVADSTAALQHLQTRLGALPSASAATSSSAAAQAAASAAGRPSVEDVLASVLQASNDDADRDSSLTTSEFAGFADACLRAQSEARRGAQRLQEAVDATAQSRTRLEQLWAAPNPYSVAVQQLQRQLDQQQRDLQQRQQQQEDLTHQVELWKSVENAFSRHGIPSFLLDGVLGELQAASSRHLTHLAAGMTLELSATSTRKTAARSASSSKNKKGGVGSTVLSSSSSSEGTGDEGSDSEADEAAAAASSSSSSSKKGKRKTAAAAAATKEEISKTVRVQGAGGALMERSVAQLSGGEKKRVALALGLGFAEVVAARGRLTSNILVLDEVLEKLDDEGCSRVAWLLKGLPYDSCFVVGQAGSFVTKELGAVDTVVKAGGRSFVELGGRGGGSAGAAGGAAGAAATGGAAQSSEAVAVAVGA